MPRTIAALSILTISGCGLVLDLDAVGPDAAGARVDASPSTDATAGDGAPGLDGGRSDGGSPADGGGGADGGDGMDSGATTSDAGPAGDSGGLLAVGEPCARDVECASGYCYDVTLSNPFCFGSTCTIACGSWSDCDDYARGHGTTAPTRACVPHSSGTSAVCDFTWGGLPGAAFVCE